MDDSMTLAQVREFLCDLPDDHLVLPAKRHLEDLEAILNTLHEKKVPGKTAAPKEPAAGPSPLLTLGA